VFCGDKIQPFPMTTWHHLYDLLRTETSSVLFLSMVRLVLAGILGGLIGLEREMKHRPAGVRTNMFICFGAAMFTILSDQLQTGYPSGDHTRIAAQIIPGIGFIGAGSILRAHGEPLDVATFAEDGGEEAEVACIYMIGPDGGPRRIGMAAGNEFSDHQFEKKNYLNLAGSKLRNCALGPELVIDAEFESVPGEVIIERNGMVLWSKPIRTGEAEMCHSLQNIEHHHFKFEQHRRPGDVHVHFLGADCLSFGEGVTLADGDVTKIRFDGFGRALRNTIRHHGRAPELVRAIPLT
jgi:hypothetical protein